MNFLEKVGGELLGNKANNNQDQAINQNPPAQQQQQQQQQPQGINQGQQAVPPSSSIQPEHRDQVAPEQKGLFDQLMKIKQQFMGASPGSSGGLGAGSVLQQLSQIKQSLASSNSSTASNPSSNGIMQKLVQEVEQLVMRAVGGNKLAGAQGALGEISGLFGSQQQPVQQGAKPPTTQAS